MLPLPRRSLRRVVDVAPGDVFGDDTETLWQRVLRRQPGELAFVATPSSDPTLN